MKNKKRTCDLIKIISNYDCSFSYELTILNITCSTFVRTLMWDEIIFIL